MIAEALEPGHIGPETTVIESTSGNLGVGLAQACRYLGLRLIGVVDSRTHAINLKTMRALGAEVRVVDRKTAGDRDLLAARLELGPRDPHRDPRLLLAESVRKPAVPPHTPKGRCARSTRTWRVSRLPVRRDEHDRNLRGCCDYLARQQRETKVVAVDAQGSALFGGEPGRRRLPGFGAGVATELSKGSWFDRLVRVSDLECVVGCRRLVDREAVLAGASAGWRRVGVRCGRSCDRRRAPLRAAVR